MRCAKSSRKSRQISESRLYRTVTLDLAQEHFESATGTTKLWNSAYRKATNYIRRVLKPYVSETKFSKGHFYLSGFFTMTSGQIFYLSVPDVRPKLGPNILIRTAESYKDYTGGRNQYISIEQFESELLDLVLERRAMAA